MDSEEVYQSSWQSNLLSPVADTFANYGWYILLSALILAYIYQNALKSVIDKYRRHKEESEYSAKYHKNPDLLTARLAAQEKRTQELQEKYQKDAEERKRKMEEKAEQKRQDLLEKLNGDGQKLGSTPTPSRSSSLKPEFNPLMGSGSSSNYRPPKRSACSRGGCG